MRIEILEAENLISLEEQVNEFIANSDRNVHNIRITHYYEHDRYLEIKCPVHVATITFE